MKPLCIDLFCGLGGWTEGFLAEGYEVVGFDNEQRPYPAQLVLQDVLTLHGSQFKGAAVIVCSPPCQSYSYLAMPWSRSKDPNNSKAAKALRHKWETEGPDNRLFDACFRIQREAIAATGEPCPDCGHLAMYTISTLCRSCDCTGRINTRYIPLIVENVRGAQPWVGRSAWNYGSFHLWGDVPALMPITMKRPKMGGLSLNAGGAKWLPENGLGFEESGQKVPGFRFDGSGRSFQTASVEATGQKQNPDGTNHPTGSWFRIADSAQGDPGTKQATAGRGKEYGGAFGWDGSAMRTGNSRSNARKAASAQIAKIPFELSRHIARVFKPRS